jgi:hypothetical protein
VPIAQYTFQIQDYPALLDTALPRRVEAGIVQHVTVVEHRSRDPLAYRFRLTGIAGNLEDELVASVEPTYSESGLRRLPAWKQRRFAKETGTAHHVDYHSFLRGVNYGVARDVLGLSRRDASPHRTAYPYAPTGAWNRIVPANNSEWVVTAQRTMPKSSVPLYRLIPELMFSGRFLPPPLDVTITYDSSTK